MDIERLARIEAALAVTDCSPEQHLEGIPCLVEDAGWLCGELRKILAMTYCAYCGECFALTDPEAAKKAVTEHIYTCKKHPIMPLMKALDIALTWGSLPTKPSSFVGIDMGIKPVSVRQVVQAALAMVVVTGEVKVT